ncbi:MAG: tRNA dihydrouridine synthase DusB [Peptostreptococcaceae bacterium]|nr:tRNA dihydrouridine synthase DusB [Peptostreptococcaceae bacterium]
MKIGNAEIENPLFLGPMAGITDETYRTICSEMGCDVTVTEMVSAKGLHYKDLKTKKLIAINESEKIAGIQIFGSDPNIMAEAAEKLENSKNNFLDINMGCPVPKVVKNGEGSALMKNPELAARIVEKVVESTKKSVSVKMRIGWDEVNVNVVDFALRIEAAGADFITVHGRTRDQYYFGKADWDIIARVKELLQIPVVLSGDVVDGPSAARALKITGCDGLMIARAAKGNPWIFSEVRHFLEKGYEIESPSYREKVQMAKFHFTRLVENKEAYIAGREFRKHSAWYLKGIPNSASVKNKINQAENPEEIFALLDTLLIAEGV